MTVGALLLENTLALNHAGITTARLDMLVLLEDVTGKDRSYLLAHPEFEITSQQLGELNKKIAQRTQHIPLAYIREQTEFYGRTFYINQDVLEPRPESETMIELLKRLVESGNLNVESDLSVLDVGTGSGALAITAKLEISSAIVYATDVDTKCLKVAHKNASILDAAVTFAQGNLLEPFLENGKWKLKNDVNPTVLLCNLPYVPNDHQLNQAAMNEPRLAIFGGSDGLDVYRTMFEQIVSVPEKPRYILTESLPFQHESLAKISRHAGYSAAETIEFIQLFIKS